MTPRKHNVDPQSSEAVRARADVFEYELPGGWRVLAGRTDADNAILSLKIAKPNDWWFHVRGMPGSHVILLVEGKVGPGRDIIKQAAAVAAYHSKAKEGGQVAVSCTRAMHVSKAHGAKRGTVTIKKEHVLTVRPKVPFK